MHAIEFESNALHRCSHEAQPATRERCRERAFARARGRCATNDAVPATVSSDAEPRQRSRTTTREPSRERSHAQRARGRLHAEPRSSSSRACSMRRGPSLRRLSMAWPRRRAHRVALRRSLPLAIASLACRRVVRGDLFRRRRSRSEVICFARVFGTDCSGRCRLFRGEVIGSRSSGSQTIRSRRPLCRAWTHVAWRGPPSTPGSGLDIAKEHPVLFSARAPGRTRRCGGCDTHPPAAEAHELGKFPARPLQAAPVETPCAPRHGAHCRTPSEHAPGNLLLS